MKGGTKTSSNDYSETNIFRIQIEEEKIYTIIDRGKRAIPGQSFETTTKAKYQELVHLSGNKQGGGGGAHTVLARSLSSQVSSPLFQTFPLLKLIFAF